MEMTIPTIRIKFIIFNASNCFSITILPLLVGHYAHNLLSCLNYRLNTKIDKSIGFGANKMHRDDTEKLS